MTFHNVSFIRCDWIYFIFRAVLHVLFQICRLIFELKKTQAIVSIMIIYNVED